MTHAFESKFESPTSAGSGDAHAGALHADSKINSIGELKAFQSANGQAQSSAEHHLPSLSFTDSGGRWVAPVVAPVQALREAAMALLLRMPPATRGLGRLF